MLIKCFTRLHTHIQNKKFFVYTEVSNYSRKIIDNFIFSACHVVEQVLYITIPAYNKKLICYDHRYHDAPQWEYYDHNL